MSLIIWGCNFPQVTNHRSYRTVLMDGQATLAPDQLDGLIINGKWCANLSDTTKGLLPDLPTFESCISVALPHRVLKPNSALWYRKTVSYDSGVLIISADDGAQLWIDQQRIKRIKGNVFSFGPKVKKQTQITIRVINNAMQGGLRKVTWISKADWKKYQVQSQLQSHAWKKTRKAELANFKLEKDSAFTNYPILFTDPVWQQESNGPTLKWVSECGGQAKVRWGKDSTRLSEMISTQSTNGVFITPVPAFEGDIFYQIEQKKSLSALYQYAFQTNQNSLDFAIWGDSQGGWEVFSRLIGLMNTYKPVFSIGAGDLVSDGSDSIAYLHYLQTLSQASFPHYSVSGNHDYDGFYDDLYPDHFLSLVASPREQTYFSWQYKNCSYIALDPNGEFPIGIQKGSDQYRWFLDQLSSPAWKQADWRFVVVHQPPYSQGWPDYHGEQTILDLLFPYFESAKIDVVISGHSHDYERLIKAYGRQQTAFIVTGGGGGGLEPVENAKWPQMDTVINQHHFGILSVQRGTLTFNAYNLDNQIIDTFVLSHEE